VAGRQKAYDSETPVLLGLKDEHDEGGYEQRAAYDGCTHFPGNFALAGTRVGPAHYEDGVEGREDVEHLEEEVPWYLLVEEVEVAGAEDGGVEDLCYKGDTWFVVSGRVAGTGDASGSDAPSALLLRWMEKMRTHFAARCERSAR
jgi:hypothetical protein